MLCNVMYIAIPFNSFRRVSTAEIVLLGIINTNRLIIESRKTVTSVVASLHAQDQVLYILLGLTRNVLVSLHCFCFHIEIMYCIDWKLSSSKDWGGIEVSFDRFRIHTPQC